MQAAKHYFISHKAITFYYTIVLLSLSKVEWVQTAQVFLQNLIYQSLEHTTLTGELLANIFCVCTVISWINVILLGF